MLRLFTYCFLIGLVLLLMRCRPKEPQTVATQPISFDSAQSKTDEIEVLEGMNIIQYTGFADNELKDKLETFLPFKSVQDLAYKSIHIKDSIEMIRQTQDLKDPTDSLIFRPYAVRAYQAILSYTNLMKTGPVFKDDFPSLIKLDRTTGSRDSTSKILPEVEVSKFFADRNFFFLGGAPFIEKLTPEDNAVYYDPLGNPETRFQGTVTENCKFLMNSIYYHKQFHVKITYGPPLSSYDSGPQEVDGIGSLTHEFVDRIPVIFITELGLVEGSLISVNLKLVPENLGCISDQPSITFACRSIISADEILAVYIPYDTKTTSSCQITRHNSLLWTCDFNDDGIPELACVSGIFSGASSDRMSESLWFCNINGVWKIIDWGQELDCT